MKLMPQGGRPAGVRNRLNSAFLEDLMAEWREHGRTAIKQMRVRSPGDFVRVVANTLPKEFTFEHTTTDLSIEERDELIAQIKQHLLTVRSEKAEPILIEAQPNKVTNG
jgi:hypothetical protein